MLIPIFITQNSNAQRPEVWHIFRETPCIIMEYRYVSYKEGKIKLQPGT